MKKNAEKFEAMKQQQQDQASCAPSVAVSTPESKPLPTNPAPAPAVNKTENDDFMKKIREQGLKKTTPDQAAVSEELIKQLVRSGQYTATQEGTTTTLSFAFSKFSDKMRGYAEDAVKNDIRKYGNNKIPPPVLSRCGNDMECLFTWVFWWNHPNAFGSSGQYWLKNGCVMTAGASSEGPAGYVSMPTELFESMKKEANKAS
jgi:hypothetical protein